MEEEAKNEETVETQTENVGFPTPIERPKKKLNKLAVIGIVLFLVALIGFFVFRKARSSREEEEVISTPSTETVEIVSETPQSTPASVSKDKIKIDIKNGTGIPGEAAYLVNKLKVLGYESITAGNADKSSYTQTEVSFSSSLSSEVVGEITKELESVYSGVKTSSSSSLGGVDVLIITGLRKGASPKAQSTASPSATPKATSSPTPTSSPTATPTPTATP